MSKTSYGVIAFKIPHPDDMTDAEIVLSTRKATYDATETLRKYGAVPSSIAEVQDMGMSDRERIGEMGVTESNTVFEGELNGKGEE